MNNMLVTINFTLHRVWLQSKKGEVMTSTWCGCWVNRVWLRIKKIW